MGWLALWDRASGFVPLSDPEQLTTKGDRLLAQGSLMVEFQLPDGPSPRPLLAFAQSGIWPLRLALTGLPNGAVSFVLDQLGQVAHHVFAGCDASRVETLRLVYAWDAPHGWGRISLECLSTGQLQIQPVARPKPWRVADLLAVLHPNNACRSRREVSLLGLSDRPEPIGPQPGLPGDLQVSTTEGDRPICDLRPGDKILTEDGRDVPLIAAVSHRVLMAGTAHPIQLRAPYLGARQNVTLSAAQRLLVRGAEVTYLFGTSAALVRAGDLPMPFAVQGIAAPKVDRLWQLVLPMGEPFQAAGLWIPSLTFAALRHAPDQIAASLAAELPTSQIRRQNSASYPCLGSFDAETLLQARVA